MTKRKIMMGWVTFFVFFFGFVYGLAKTLYPLEFAEGLQRVELWKTGIRDVKLGEFHGLLQDHCDPRLKSGEGCTCVALIHGLGDNAMTWKKILSWPKASWQEMGLNQPLRILALDLAGSGQTPPPSEPTDYRVRSQARAIQSALGQMCPKWIVVGNSLGGWIASWLTLDFPDRVSRMVLLSPAGLKAAQAEAGSLLTQPTVESLKEFQKKAYFHPRPIPESVWRQIVERAKKSQASQIRNAQVEEDFLDLKLGSIQRPTLILWGQADQIISIQIGYQMRSLIPGVLWREVPECGHLPQKECPSAVIRAILEMIQYGSA
jgi:pimeloyl-ACP methyl ester carboxylesterase